MFTTIDMVYIPAGEFRMGCDACNPSEQCVFEDELPLHSVFLSDYAIDRTEVTNAEYAACVSSGYCSPLDYSSPTLESYYHNPEFADYPMLWVDHYNARYYCQSLWGGDLPTEAQWEKAARGSGGTIVYPWGYSEPDCSLANFNIWNGSEYEYCVGGASVVGAYPEGASPYGVLDMSGNVWEWIRDWYGSDYYSQPDNSVNPTGPLSGTLNVMRGGSWLDYWYELRVANRGTIEPTAELDILGFRCVKEFGE
jgi:formylglycine-generating enzyme required for sulfatase activity